MNAPNQFSKNGYAYTLLKQTGKIALYKALSQADAGPRSFEAVILRHSPERAILGRTIPASVRLPSNEDFGIWGWSYTGQEAAEKKYQELLRRTA